jgi:Transposase DDE domain group 1
VAVCAGRPTVWNSRRGNHLGQRSCATAYKGRTYDRKRSDQNSAQQSCEPGAIHIWLMLTLRDAIPKAHALATAEFNTIRLRLLKLGARVVEMTSRVRLAFAAACPDATLIRHIAAALMPTGP